MPGAIIVTTAVNPPPTIPPRGRQKPGNLQLVGFRLGDEEYGIDITKIQEVILMGEITRVPQTPAYVKGLINLRSNVIPIIDLRLRFGMTEISIDSDTRIVVVNMIGKTVGLIVDAVNEVIRVSQDTIASLPPAVAGLGREYLTGLVQLESRLVIVLNIDMLLDDDASIAHKSANGAAY